jgi:hypothetical protein
MSNQEDLALLAEARCYYGDAVHYDDGIFSIQTGKHSALACRAELLRTILFDMATPRTAAINTARLPS